LPENDYIIFTLTYILIGRFSTLCKTFEQKKRSVKERLIFNFL